MICVTSVANACIPIGHANDGAYVGGDLAEQIAAKAHTIQIVRARARHLMERHYTDIEHFWWFGRWPERERVIGARRISRERDIYVYEFEVEDTIKGGAFGGSELDSAAVRARAFDGGTDRQMWLSYDAMLGLVLDRPARDGAVLNIAAVDPSDASSCFSGLALTIGEHYLVLRDDRGDIQVPHMEDGGFRNRIGIDVDFGTGVDSTTTAPGVLQMTPQTEELVRRIRRALSTRPE